MQANVKALVYDDALDAPNAGHCQHLSAKLAFTTMVESLLCNFEKGCPAGQGKTVNTRHTCGFAGGYNAQHPAHAMCFRLHTNQCSITS